MNDSRLSSPTAIKTFLEGTRNVDLRIRKKQRYAWLARLIKTSNYFSLKKKEKSIVQEYMKKMTSYSRQQLSKLISQYKTHQWIGKSKYARNHVPIYYTKEDILLLAETDKQHQTLSGATTKKLFERAYNIYGEQAYIRLATISVSHIYNLRKSKTYKRHCLHFNKTKSTTAAIGTRKKPAPNNQPGYIRVDTVHQGDKEGHKGVYHINAVDEVTQFEIVCSVEKISENNLIPILEIIINSFPFNIINFHADNGSEYINHCVVKLLNKLHIELTKSRARHSNDNALVESKNGSVIRKHLGYVHVPQKYASFINNFYKYYLNPYINYHRPCYFAEVITDNKGKQKKIYPYKNMMTPYEKLKSLPNAKQYLKSNISFKKLDKIAMKITDLQSAKIMQKAKKNLFTWIFKTEEELVDKPAGTCE